MDHNLFKILHFVSIFSRPSSIHLRYEYLTSLISNEWNPKFKHNSRGTKRKQDTKKTAKIAKRENLGDRNSHFNRLIDDTLK